MLNNNRVEEEGEQVFNWKRSERGICLKKWQYFVIEPLTVSLVLRGVTLKKKKKNIFTDSLIMIIM